MTAERKPVLSPGTEVAYEVMEQIRLSDLGENELLELAAHWRAKAEFLEQLVGIMHRVGQEKPAPAVVVVTIPSQPQEQEQKRERARTIKACCVANCDKFIVARGLCANHYHQALLLVKAGGTTWPQFKPEMLEASA